MSKNSVGQPDDSRPKRKGGRPTRYRKEFAEQALKLCRLGATDVELADFFEVGETTLNRWKAAHPRFRESLKEGKSQADAEVASKLFKRATGYSHLDTKFATHEGKITDAKEYVKHYAPDTIACIFWLKNRRPDLWRDRVGVEHTGKDGGPIKQEAEFKVTPEDEAVIARIREKRDSIQKNS
jgi:excinuclease UvrABC nuclease subunit